MVEERATKIKKKLCEVEIHIVEVEEAFRQQKERVDTLSSGIIHSAKKIGELHQKIVDTHNGEARANEDMKVMVVDLERKY